MFARSRKKWSETSQANLEMKRNLKNIRRELQELKRVQIGQDADNNPLSLKIQAEIVPPTFGVPKKKF